uniref:NTR domain-containing protein n=1 Tax=Sinocyclocheilus anshuiensis TaxID=1608454 RepID=A0A671SIB0_9TELE
VVVQLFGYDKEITVDLKLKNILAPSYKEYASQSLKLNAANNYQASATLRIMPTDFPKEDNYVYLQAISSAFTAHEKIPVTTVNGFLFIQTDKPLYTPEQEVQVRVYSLNEELRKSRRTVTLTFVDPNGIKVEIIDMTDINGAKPLLPPFKIPLKPIYGIWKILATYADTFETTATAEFEVKEYVLPSISLHIQPEANYVSEKNFESFQLKISAKYVFFLFYFTAMKENTFLRVRVLFQESTGGISQEAVLSNVKFVDTPFTLNLIATPPFIKPGLPYSMRVLVKDPLGKPVQGVSITTRATITTANNEQDTLKFLGHKDTLTVTSQRDGIAYFICNIPANVKIAEFTVSKTFETEDPSWSQDPLKLKAESYVSVNHRYLYINLPESSVFEVGQYISINIYFDFRDYLSLKTFSYQIISRGKVVQFDTVKWGGVKNQNLNIKITPDMVPSARLVVYYVLYGEEKSELVADSTWIDVKAKCVNNLNVMPFSLPSVIVNREESLVAFSAVDTALYNLKSNDKDPLKKVLQHVERSDLGCGRGGGKNNADVFDRVGLMFITNANAKTSSAGTSIDFLLDAMPSQIRSYFPEKNFLNHNPFCLIDNPNLYIRIIKNILYKIYFIIVFVDVPLPYSMVRGEQIELRGSVYNQHLSSTQFSVTLTATEGVCVFRGAQQGKDGKPHENKGNIAGRSVAFVTFYIMALEASTHTLTFTLTTKYGTESVVKKLKVVVRGNTQSVSKSPVTPSSCSGEVLGELLSIINNPEGLKQLTNLPRGNVEMELMALLPIYYVYHYLEKAEKWDILGKEAAASEKQLKRKMQAGITSIMSFKLKHEHAFSMWSKKDKSASTWVTALIVKTLADMHEYVSLEPEVLTNTINWLIKNCQNDDGSFSEKSQTNPHKLMGAGADVTEKTVFLTSFVMIGIKNVFKIAIDRAAQYITSNSKKIESLYARAIASYALTLADIHSMSAVGVYEILKKQAQVDGNPATVRFWQESKLLKDSLKPSDVTAKTVETTVYVLLNTLVRGDATYAKPILNWLTQDQRYGGGVHSTQDSILTLEALTKYSILASRATLDMVVDIEYKTKGDIRRIRLTQQKPVHKPIEVTKNDDIIIKTAMSSGVNIHSYELVSYYNDGLNMILDDFAPVKTRTVSFPHENAFETESGITVMEIHLPTGVTPVQEDLDMVRYLNGLESRISNYEINGDQVILQIDSIPSEELYCVGFRVQEEFETGMTRASVFEVYEFSNPENKCVKFYHKQSRKLLRLCEGDQCQCMAAECCNFKSTIDPKITAVQRKNDMCKESMNYETSFMTASIHPLNFSSTGQTDDLKTDSEIDLVKKATCSSTNFEVGKQYLIMTAESIKIQMNRGYKYKFPLDSHAWVDWWPLDTDCRDDACKQYASVLEEFEFDFLLSGCED